MATKRKLPKIANYVKNVGKSLAFASVDVVKDYTPGINEFLETNEETFKKMYAGAKNYKQTLKGIERNLKQSNVFKALDVGLKSIIEDAKSGTFYNTSRAASFSEEALGMEDDFDFDMSFDDGESSSSGGGVSNDSKFLAGSLEGSIASSAIATSTAVAQGTGMMVRSSRLNTKLILGNMDKISNTITSGLGTLYGPVSEINKFMQGPLHNHLENSKMYFENSIRIQQESQAMLKEMLDMQRAMYQTQSTEYKQTPLDAVFSNGTFNVEAYLKTVKGNIMDKLDESGLSMIAGDSGMNPLLMIAAAPFNDAVKGIIKKVLPGGLKKALKSFDKGVSTFFSSLVAQMNDNAKNGDGIWETLGEILGFKVDKKEKMDTSKYKKTDVPFDGVTRKAITEVIPGYLSRIEAAITGQDGSNARHYDYNEGKWKTGRQLEGDWKKMIEQQIYSSNYELMTLMRKEAAKLTKKEGERLLKEVSDFTKQVFDDKGDVKINKRNGDDMDPAMYYGMSPENFEFLKKILTENTQLLRDMGYNNMRGNQQLSRAVTDLENNGSSAFNVLFDRSYDNGKENNRARPSGYETTNNIINRAKDKEGRGIFSYLKDMLNTIKQIATEIPKRGNANGKKAKRKQKRSKSQNGSSSSSSDDSSDSDPDPDLGGYERDQSEGYGSVEELGREIDRQREEANKKQINRGKLGTWIREILDKTAVGRFINAASDKLGGLVSKPMEYATKLLNKADEKLFNLMFGDKLEVVVGDETKQCDNLLQYVGYSIEGTFKKVYNDIKEQILKPLKDKMKEWFQPIIDKYVTPVWENIKDMLGRGKDRVAEAFPNTFGKAFEKIDEKRRERKAKKQAEKDMENGGVASADDIENAKNDDDVKTSAAGRYVTKRGLTMISPGEIIIPASFDPKEQARMLALEKRDRGRILNAIGNNKISLNAKGTVDPKEVEKTKSFLYNLYKDNTGKYGKNAAAGVIGAGAGILTGFGPVIGAVAGAGLSILTNSETFRTVMFGKAIKDEEGNVTGREGGIISKKIYDIFQKAAPDMGNFGITGGLLGLITPFGPLGGAAIGAGIGFLKNSESFKKFVFGDENSDGLMKEETYKKFKEKMNKAVPSMGVGALAGIMAGPFGLLGNAAMGAGVGLLTSTDTFKKFLFGDDAKWQGNETGGMVGALYRGIVMPAQNHIAEIFTDLKEWGKKNILEPLKTFWKPFKQMIKNIFRDLGRSLENMFKDMVGKPIYDFLQQKIFKPVTNTLFKIIKAPLNIGKAIVSAPFKALQGLGHTMKLSQIRRGTADDMSASQRLAYRDDHSFRSLVSTALGKDKTIEEDKMMAGMTTDQISTAINALAGLNKNSRKLKEEATNASRSANNKVSSILNQKQDNGTILWDLSELKKTGDDLKKYASSGDVKSYQKLVKSLHVSDETKAKLLDKKVLSSIQTAKDAHNKSQASKRNKKDLEKEIQEITGGRKLSDKDLKRFQDNLESELRFRRKADASQVFDGNSQDAMVRMTAEYQNVYSEKTDALIKTLNTSNDKLNDILSGKIEENDPKTGMLKDILGWLKRFGSTIKGNVTSAVEDYGENVVDDVVNGVANAGAKVAQKGKNIAQKGKNIATKAANGIKNLTKNAKDGDTINADDIDVETSAFGGVFNKKTASMVSKGERIEKKDSFIGAMKNAIMKPMSGLVKAINNKPVLDPTTGNMITNNPDSKENTENVRKHQEMEKRDIEQLNATKSSVGMFKAFGEKLFGGDKKKKGGILSSLGSGLGGILKFLGVGTSGIAKMGLKVLGIAGGVSLLGFASEWFKNSVWPVMKTGLFGDDGKSGLIGGVVDRAKTWFESGGFSNLLSEKIIPNFITGLSYSMENIVGPSIALLVKHLPSILWGLAKGLFKGLKSITFKNKMDGQEEKEMLAASGFKNSSSFLNDFSKMNSQRNRSLESNMDPAMRKSLSPIKNSNTIAYTSSSIGGGLDTGGESRSDSSSNGDYTTNTSSTTTNNYITQNADKFDDGELENPNQTLTVEQGPMGLLGQRKNTNIVRYDDQGNVLTQYDRRNTHDSILSSAAKAAGLQFRKGILTGKRSGKLVNALANMKTAGPKLGILGNIVGGTKNIVKAGANAVNSAGNLGASLYDKAFDSIVEDSRESSGLNDYFRKWGGEAAANFTESRNMAENVAEGATKAAAKETTKSVAETGAKKGISKLLKTAGDAVGDSAIVKGIKELFGKFAQSEMVQKFCKFAQKHLKRAIDPSTIQDAIIKLGGTISKRCTKNATKTAVKEAAEQIANACTLGIGAIASFIADFTYGFRNAYTMLGVAKGSEYEVNFGMKCACGLVHAIVNLIPFVGGFIPTDVLMQLVMTQILPVLGYDATSLKEAQAESSKLMDEWNKEHPDEQYDNLEDFNNKDKLWSKFKKGAGKALSAGWEKTKSVAGKGVELVKKGFSAVADKTKEIAGKALDIGGFIKTVTTNVIKTATDPEYSWNIDEVITEDDPLAGAKRTIYQVLKVPLGILGIVSAAGKAIFDKVKGFVSDVKDGTMDAWDDIKHVAKGEYSVFNPEYWKFNDDDSDNPLGIVSKVSSIGVKYMGMPIAMIGYAGSKVWQGLKALLPGLKDGTLDAFEDIKAVSRGEYSVINPEYWKFNDENSDNPLGIVGKITSSAIKFMAIPQAMIGYAGSKVWQGLKALIAGAKEGNMDADSDVEAVSSGKYTIFNSQYWSSDNNDDGNELSTLGKVFGFITRTLRAPAAMVGYVSSKVKEKFNDFIDKAKDVDTENDKIIEKAEQGQLSVFSSEYWKVSGKDDNPLGILGTITSFIQRLVNAPIIAIKGMFNKIKEKISGSSIGDWFSRLFGENGGETSNNGMGKGKKFGFGRVSQLDPDVANMPYNGHTIAEAGCGPVAATNLINNIYGSDQIGGDIVNLADAAQYSVSNGFKPSNDGTDPKFMRSILNNYGIQSQNVTGRQQIENSLMNGDPVVMMGKGNSPDSPYGNNNPHYITAMGFDEDGNVIVDDPYENELTSYPENEVMSGVMDSLSAKRYSGYGKSRRILRKGFGKATRQTSARRFRGFGKFGFGKVLGHISAKYETGGWNPGMVSSGAGDYGGVSYGLSQFSTTQGSAKSFVKWLSQKSSTLGGYFSGKTPGTAAFGDAWKKCYSEHGDEFTSAQVEYTYENMVKPWIEKAKSQTGIDFTRSMALKEAAYSTAVQFGPAGTKMLKNVTAGMSDKEVIETMYNDKINNVSSYFRSSSASVQAGVKSRFQREKADLLALIGKDGEYSYTGPDGKPSGIGIGSSNNTTESKGGSLLQSFAKLGASMTKAMFGQEGYSAIAGSNSTTVASATADSNTADPNTSNASGGSGKGFGKLFGFGKRFGFGTNYPKYELTDDQINDIATCITGETGGSDPVAAKQEASQMVNLNESKGRSNTGADLSKTLHSGWYAKSSWTRGCTDTAKQAVKDVIINGNRTLPRYVIEHDTFPMDILSPKGRNDYKTGDPVNNKYGSKYKFYTFFGQNKDGDIAGYTDSLYDKYKGDQPYGADSTGSTDGSSSGQQGTSTTLLGQFSNLGTSMVKAMFGDEAYEALYGSQQSTSSDGSNSSSSTTAANGSVESFVQTAINEEGYHEKASNSNLDDKSANSGRANYTKYGQHFKLNGQPWCAQFVSWAADTAGIPESAINRTAAVPEFNSFFRSKNRLHTPGSGYTPKRGDVFMKGGEHTGIVTGVVDGKLKTIEGNSSDQVAQRSYNLSSCGFNFGDLGLGSGTGTSGTEGTTGSTKVYGKLPIRRGRNAKTQYAKQMGYGYGAGTPAVRYSSTSAPAQASSQSVDYETFLQTIISILMNISDNSAVLSKILDILSNQFDINIDKTDLDKASTKTKEQTEASLRDLINRSNNNNTGISKLLNNKDTDYVVKAMKAIASE